MNVWSLVRPLLMLLMLNADSQRKPRLQHQQTSLNHSFNTHLLVLPGLHSQSVNECVGYSASSSNSKPCSFLATDHLQRKRGSADVVQTKYLRVAVRTASRSPLTYDTPAQT